MDKNMMNDKHADLKDDLLISMAEIDDKFIMEAEGKQHFRRSGIFAELGSKAFLKPAAAILALFILAVPVGLVIRSNMLNQASGDTVLESSPVSEGENELAAAGVTDDQTGMVSAGGYYVSGNSGDGQAKGIDQAQPEVAGGINAAGGEDSAVMVLDETILERVLGTELAGLRLGMTESEVIRIAGEPDSRSEYTGVKADIQAPAGNGSNGLKIGFEGRSGGEVAIHGRVTWFYQISHENTDLKMSLGMAFDHGQWILDGIRVWASEYALTNGIHPGSSLKEVEKACPEYEHIEEAPVIDGNHSENYVKRDYFSYGTQESGYDGTYIDILLEDEVVKSISIEHYFRDLTAEAYDSGQDALYMLGSNNTVIWDTGNGKAATLTPKQCKKIEVIANIEDLEEGTSFKEAAYVIDFHNDTVMLLSGHGEQGAVCTISDRETFEASVKSFAGSSGQAAAAGELIAGINGLDLIGYYNFPEGCLAAVEEILGEVSR